MWTAVAPYAKKYWWIALIAGVVFSMERISALWVDIVAYRNPQTKIIMVTKKVTKNNIVRVVEKVTSPDGTVTERERFEDKSVLTNDTDSKTEKTPILKREWGVSLSGVYSVKDKELEAKVGASWRNLFGKATYSLGKVEEGDFVISGTPDLKIEVGIKY